MAGWIAFQGMTQEDIRKRIKTFEKIFNVAGVPRLRMEERFSSSGFSFWGWAWNLNEIPDMHTHDESNVFLALDGVVTDFGDVSGEIKDKTNPASVLWPEWRRRGPNLVGNLNGSFSILVHDARANLTTIFTDRFASRPVCWTGQGSSWIAGNSPSALAAVSENTPPPDGAALWSFLHLGRRVGERTIFCGINHLLAGQKVNLDKTGHAPPVYWRQRRYQPVFNISPPEWGERIASALKASGTRYSRICRAPHLFLSGGLDSRIVAGAFGPGLQTVSLCTAPNAETRAAGRVAAALGLPHRVMVRSPHWDLETADAAALISAGDHLHQHTHFFVPVRDIHAEEPRAEFLLGDLQENFNKHYFAVPRRLDFSFDFDFLRDNLEYLLPSTVKGRERLGIHLRPEYRKQAREAYDEALKKNVAEVMAVAEEDADRLDSLLRWSDVGMTYTYNMFTCIRALAPERNLYFDNDLDALSLQIPAKIRGAGILHRRTLGRLNPKLTLIPEANTFVPPAFPRWLGKASKKIRPVLGRARRALAGRRTGEPVLTTSGSWLLKQELYRKDERYRGWVENLLADREAFPEEIFDGRRMSKTWAIFLDGDDRPLFEIEALLSFGNLWRKLSR